MNAIVNIFYQLTKRNWGAPWHFITVCLVTLIYIEVAKIELLFDWWMCLYMYLVFQIIIIYEIIQIKRKVETKKGAAEDIILGVFGFWAACIPLLKGTYEDLFIFALAPLLVMKKKIPLVCLDPGHGGVFPGAEAGGLQEKNVNMRYVHRIRQILNTLGIDSILTRISEEFDKDLKKDLQARADLANAKEVDLFVSIHCNAYKKPEAHGFEIWTSKGETKADKAATRIYKEVEAALPDLKMRKDVSDGDKDKEGNFKVLTATEMPAVLIELGFITNDQERALLTSYKYTEDLSLAIANGIAICFK